MREPVQPRPACGERIEVRGLELGRKKNPRPTLSLGKGEVKT